MKYFEIERLYTKEGQRTDGSVWKRYILKGKPLAEPGQPAGKVMTLSTFDGNKFLPKSFEDLKAGTTIAIEYTYNDAFHQGDIVKVAYEPENSNYGTVEQIQDDYIPIEEEEGYRPPPPSEWNPPAPSANVPAPQNKSMAEVMDRAVEQGFTIAKKHFAFAEPGAMIDASIRIGLSMFIQYYKER